jgi:hypothetical protein
MRPSKPGGEQPTLVEVMPIPVEKFSLVHLDIVSSEGHTHLPMVLDRTTRWPEAFPLKAISARECADCFVIPLKVTTERGVCTVHF